MLRFRFGGVVGVFLLLSLLGFVLLLALRSNRSVEERSPSLGTLESCGAYCRSLCFRSLYDQVRAEIFVEGNRTKCVCQCRNSLHEMISG
ncbi:hypothetical protein J4439_06855 [Candidatus Woesearchaeota archaeon]|nr:hypothetical protein [Candidatus Woesearchaeota archaeon]